MRVVFPCKGVIVLPKEDKEKLENLYNMKLKSSKVYDYYISTNNAMQIGNFYYFPEKSGLYLKNPDLLTIKKMRDLLNIPVSDQVSPNEKDDDIAIPDDSFLNHPFFQTLKPIN